jgi:hypothetical protein
MHNCQFSKHKSISIIDNNVLLHYLTAYAFSRVCLVFCFIQETCIVYIGCLWRALFLNINGVKLHAQLKCLVFSLNYILGSCLDRSHGERTRDISRVLAEIKLDQVRDNRKSPSVRRTRRDDFELESSREEKDRAYMHDSQNRDTGMGAGYASSRGQGLHSGVSASQGE